MKKFDFNLVDAAKSFNVLLDERQDSLNIFDADEAVAIEKEEKFGNALKDIERAAFAIVNDGIDPETGVKLKAEVLDTLITKISKNLKDLTGVSGTSVLTQQILTRALEYTDTPESIFQYFSTEMAYKTGTQLLVPYIGDAVGARDYGPSQELPVLSFDESMEVISKTGRSGVRVQLDDETMRTSNYGLLNTYIALAKRSLIRWKDKKAVSTVLSQGKVVFDNFKPESSVYGHTSGRSAKTGKLNGGFTLRDLFKMYMHGHKEGYRMDTILISNWGYLMFMNDPVLRRFTDVNGGVLFSAPRGTAGVTKRNLIAKQSREHNPSAMNSYAPEIPKQLIDVNFRIIVTDYIPTYKEGNVLYSMLEHGGTTQNVPYTWTDPQFKGTDEKTLSVANVSANIAGAQKHPLDADTLGSDKKAYCGANPMTDLVMLDSTAALLYLNEEGVRTETKVDNIYELTTIVFKERYSFAMLEKSRAVLVAKNIVITEDLFDYEQKVTVSVTEMNAALEKGVE